VQEPSTDFILELAHSCPHPTSNMK